MIAINSINNKQGYDKMKDLLKTKYTIITSDGQYIVESYNNYLSLHSEQCPVLTFDNLSQVSDLLRRIKESKEFDWIELYIIKIDKQII